MGMSRRFSAVAVALAASLIALPVAAQQPPATPTPSFNFDEVKEVVSELRATDGTTHYVTLDEDTEGVVRVRLSLFSLPASSYNAVVFRNGNCANTASFGPDDVLVSSQFELKEQAGLVLWFFNTRAIGIKDGAANTIYDADGTSLALYVPGDSGAGPIACARLDRQPGAPAAGDSPGASSAVSSASPWAAGALALGLGAIGALTLRRVRMRR